MTSSKNSEDNAQDSDQSEQNTAYQSNQNIYEKQEKQRICEIYDSGETEGNTQENHLYEKKQQGSDIRSPEEGKGNTQDPDKEPDSSNQDNVCPTCTKTVRTGVQCGICKHCFHYKCEKVTKEEVELKYPEEQEYECINDQKKKTEDSHREMNRLRKIEDQLHVLEKLSKLLRNHSKKQNDS